MKQCQSCGMPLSQDPDGGGTNADGTRSDQYCSYCFVDGQFMQPDMTAQEMQAFCVEKMREQGMWKPLAWLMTRGIPKLDRWKTG